MKASPYADARVAGCYDHLAVPHHFEAPAKALVACADLPANGLVLDVGSGTGAAAIAAARAVGTRGRVVALDPSFEMVRILRAKGWSDSVVAQAPGLPFEEGRFDAVVTSFVLSHFTDYRTALADLTRVLRPGGRLAASAWGSDQPAPAQLWREVIGRFVPLATLRAAVRAIIPWEEHFSNEFNLGAAFEEAGLTRVVLEHRVFSIRMSVTDYLAIREAGVEGTLLRQMLGGNTWSELQQSMRAAFRCRFDAVVEYPRGVHFGCGTKPEP